LILISAFPFGISTKTIEQLDATGVSYQANSYRRRFTEAELISHIGNASILIAGTEPITATAMDAAPKLQLIAKVGIGVDNVDLNAAKERRIAVTYTPDAPAPAVAELTIGLMIDLVRGISHANRLMHDKQWLRILGRRLDELTIGVVGVGRVGRRLIRILRAGFPNARVLSNDLEPDEKFAQEVGGLDWVTKSQLYSQSDIVTLHVPLTQATRGLISEREFMAMKPTAVLINTSRGGIVDEEALAAALRSHRLAGAAMDVFEPEPYTGILTNVDECILTCHMGSMSEDCRIAMESEAVEEVVRFIKGESLRQLVPESEYLLQQLGSQEPEARNQNRNL
jgi:D-3-phosphoglycerate dehydrogenase / 2-oxoglutarate reductase